MIFILIIALLIIVGVCGYYFYKRNIKNNGKGFLMNRDLKDKVAIKVEQLPIESIENDKMMFEITDNKLIGQVTSLVPDLLQVATTTNNAIQASSDVLYKAIIPAGTKLVESNDMKNAFRGMYRGDKGIDGHANLVQVNQSKNVIANTVSSGIAVTSMVVGQYYMTQINSELDKINDEISKITTFQNTEYKSKILALVVQIKRISTFQVEILENKKLRNMEIDKLNNLEQTCIELLGQANLTIKEFTNKDYSEYDKYNEDLKNIHYWYSCQKILLEVLYRITELKNVLYLGIMSKEQLNIVLDTYTKQVMEVQELLIMWHKKIIQKLEIDTNASRRKRQGIDGVIYLIPGLFNQDLNFCSISEESKKMIEDQTSNYKATFNYNMEDVFNKDVELISKNGKLYYMPK